MSRGPSEDKRMPEVAQTLMIRCAICSRPQFLNGVPSV